MFCTKMSDKVPETRTQMNKPTIVSLEGNIGSGKSTLLSYLENYFKGNAKILFLKEPVEDWETIRDENDVTILEKFYKDQEKYSFPFQMMAYISRLVALKEAVEKNPAIIITERSLYTDRMVFAKMLYDDGKIEFINYRIYLKWFDSFAKEFPVDKVIYVKASPSICHFRIKMRSRIGESVIPLDYLESCNRYHEAMLDKKAPDCVCHNQLILDGSVDIHEKKEIMKTWISQIEEFIKS